MDVKLAAAHGMGWVRRKGVPGEMKKAECRMKKRLAGAVALPVEELAKPKRKDFNLEWTRKKNRHWSDSTLITWRISRI